MPVITNAIDREITLEMLENLFGSIYVLTGGGADVATATAAAATVTATQAAVEGKEHLPFYFEVSAYDAAGGVDGSLQVEIIRDNAGAGGGAAVLWQQFFEWDVSEDVLVKTVAYMLPCFLESGTKGETLDITVTNAGAVAVDEIVANIWSVQK